MIDPAAIAESIYVREVATFVLSQFKNDRGMQAIARESLKARLIAELKGAADHGRQEADQEMLEALKAVVRVADRATVEFDMARAAIARVEGRDPQ